MPNSRNRSSRGRPRKSSRHMSRGQKQNWWFNLEPGIRSALIISIFVVIVQLINAFTLGFSFLAMAPVLGFLYLVNGILAAKYYYDDRFHRVRRGRSTQAVRQGSIAGFAQSIISWVIYGVIGFLLGLVTFGVGWVGFVGCLVCGPADMIIGVLLSSLGAWLFEKVWA